jgi:PAS domain S-box-containing protein
MRRRSDPTPDWEELEQRIIGLGERSLRKSYYPELQQRLADLERFRALLDQSNDAVCLMEVPSGRLADVNEAACHLLGYAREALLARTIFDVLDPGFARTVRELFARVRGVPEERRIFSADLKGKTGTAVPVEIAVRFVVFGESLYAVAVARDVTERRQAEEALRFQQQQLIQADKLASLGILVSGLAHEVNNPNNFILLNAKILARVWDEILPILDGYYERNGDFVVAGMPFSEAREEIPRLLSGVAEGGERIRKIVQNLKDFARPDPGERSGRVDMNAVVDSAVLILNNLIRTSTSRFTADLARGLPPVRGSFHQLEQVVINLITNACQALGSREQGVSVATLIDPDGETVVVRVTDEGEGILPENLDRILDPFFTTKRDEGGTGLGLSVSYRIVQEHGGKLAFASEPGRGTTVRLCLPAELEGRPQEASR